MGDWDLRALFLAHRRELEVYLTRQVRCRDTAADLVQEAFARLAQQLPAPAPSNARAYLYRTAQNLAIDHFRRGERRQTYPVPLEHLADLPDAAVPADRAFEARWTLEALREAMGTLPRRTQEIFELNRIEGLTYVEVAQHLGISESSVQKHLATALLHVMRWRKSL